MLRLIVIIWVFSFWSCSNESAEKKHTQGWLYYFDRGSDTLKSICIDNQKIIPIKHLPSSCVQYDISSDGKKLLYGVKSKVNDTTDYYNIRILDMATGNNQLVGNGYGGAWSHNGNRFIVFMEDTLWLYEYPSLKIIKTFRYKADWRLCSVDWTPSGNQIVVFAYDRKSDNHNSKMLLFNSGSLNIVREEKMDSIYTKRFVAVNDKVFLCCVQCSKCNLQEPAYHLLQIDLSKSNVFTHIPIKVFGKEDIAFIENTNCIIYPDSKSKAIVMTPLGNIDSFRVIIPTLYVTLVGWSNNCVMEK